MRSLLPLGLLALLPSVASADDDKKAAVQPIKVVVLDRKTPVSYEKDVEPILVNKCAFCHSGNLKEGKLDMATFETLMKGGKRGAPILPGKSADSPLIKFCGKTEKPFMPPKGEEPLTPEELALIKLWIDQGAKPPAGVREKPKVIVTAPPVGVHPIRGIVVSPDKSAVVASRGNQIHVYDAGSGAYVRSLIDPDLTTPDKKPLQAAHLSLVESLALSPDGKYIASGGYQEVILWDAQTGMMRHRLTGFSDRVVALAFSNSGKMLATGGGSPTEDGEVKVFDVATAKLAFEIKNAHSDTVFGVSFNPSDTILATCGADKFVKTFEVPSDKLAGPIVGASNLGLASSPAGLGPLLATSALVPVRTGKLLKSFEGHTHHVLDVGWKADGKLLASAGADNVVKVWDYEKGEQVRTIPAHGKQVTRLVFIGKTSQFVTCSGDTQVRFWNADNGGNTRNFGGSTDFLYAVGVSPDGAVVAAGGEEGIVRLYNGGNGQLIKALLPPDAEAPKK
jgi:WD40 repeat protein